LLLKLFFKRMGTLDIDATKLLFLSELEQCITGAIGLNLAGNSITNALYVLVPNELELSKAINATKTNYVCAMNTALNLLKLYVKHANLLTSNPLYTKMPQLLEYFIQSTSSLFDLTPYHTLPLKSAILETVDNILAFFITSLRVNDFYPLFSQHKSELIDKVVLPCLALTPREATSFYEDPAEFILFSLQVVDRDIKSTAAFMAANYQ
jgi:hypothetical protein